MTRRTPGPSGWKKPKRKVLLPSSESLGKPEESSLPWWLLGTGAAVGGAGLALRAGLSAADAQKLEGFTAIAQKPYSNTESGYLERLSDYSTAGHEAASATLFGATSKDVLKLVRRTMYPPGHRFAWAEGDGAHYDQFAKSPISAYAQLLAEMPWGGVGTSRAGGSGPDAERLRWMLEDPSISSFKDALGSHFDRKLPEGLGREEFFSRLTSAWKTFKTETGASEEEVPVGGSAFDSWLQESDPELAQAKQFTDLQAGLVTRSEGRANGYANLTRTLSRLRKYLPWAGGALALGGAGWLLNRYLSEDPEDEKKKKERAAASAAQPRQTPPLSKAAAASRRAGFLDGAWQVLEESFGERAALPTPGRQAFCRGFADTFGTRYLK